MKLNIGQVKVIDKFLYKYLLEKIEAGEKDIAEGRTLSHKDAIERLS